MTSTRTNSKVRFQAGPAIKAKTKIMTDLRQIGGMQMASDAAKKAHDTIYQDENFDGYARQTRTEAQHDQFFYVLQPTG